MTLQSNAEPVVHEDRAFGALLGLAVGDALGATLEFSTRDSRPEVRDLVGGGPFGLEPGQWTDDTSMALCLAESLMACPQFDAHDLMHRFVRWYRQGENSVTGSCFDIGTTTRRSLERFERTEEMAKHAPEDPQQAGNGTLMRLAPVAIFAAPDASLAMQLAASQSETTHPAPVAHDACRFFAKLLVEAITGENKDDVLQPQPWIGSHEVRTNASGKWKAKSREEISSSGYVISTLEAALWSVSRTATFEDALILAVNLGHDSDTVGAVTGQLAGALYGRKGIPSRWLETLAWRERIEECVANLLEVGRRTR